jgi:nucleoside-diphosphate-sugar epimerase
MKIVLVTGASGFIGRHAVDALQARGYRVHGVSRWRPDRDVSGAWHEADLFDDETVRRVLAVVRPTHLLHLAWDTTHGRYWTSPANLRWVEASLRLGREFHDAGGRRFVGAGTCAEYSWDDRVLGERLILEDQTPRAPRALYGIAKNATFEVLQSFAAQVGMGFAWGRVFFPYGPDDHRPTLIPSVIAALRLGQPALVSEGRQQRDFIYARDAGAALAALVDSEVGGAVNIGTGTASSIADVATTLGTLLGRSDLVRLGALPPRTGEPRFLIADTRRLREEVGFIAKTTLPEGLREIIGRRPQQPPGRDSGGAVNALHR